MQTVCLLPLTHCQIPAILGLDQLCLGGLWNDEGYSREIDSPNSDLLILERMTDKPTPRLSLDIDRSDVAAASASQGLSPEVTPSTLSPMGMGCCWAIVDEAHITLLAIHPAYRRQGLATAILLELLHRARLRGLQWATLEVRISNQGAIALYQSLGFQSVGERRKYYQDTGESALILWRKGLQTDSFHADLVTWQSQNRLTLQKAGWNLWVAPIMEREP
ncbi:MAG: ribosomal protein S18-alanine N-acetyltransferase [Elainellaceae cyanobacterium]